MTDILYLLAGLGLLVVGGEFLVRGAVQAAERLGISPLLIGLTLVGFGTSTPELVASVQAALAGSPGIAVGNIVGSNIANILLILGIAALINPITVTTLALKRDGSLVVATALLLTVVGFVWTLDRIAGAAFLMMLFGYIYYAWRQEQTGCPDGHTCAYEKAQAYEEAHTAIEGAREPGGSAAAATSPAALVVPLAIALGGLAIVVLGGRLLVDGAIGMARGFGISETVIGLTIVAVGTSTPELVTSVIAALRRHSDVAIGNILGSNIYNILGIGGVTALIQPTPIPPEIVRFDNLVMVGVSVLLMVFAWTGLRIGRREGAVMAAGYVAYVWVIWPR